MWPAAYRSYTVNNASFGGIEMSKVVSIRLSDDQYERLQRLAKRERRAPSSVAGQMLEEELRMREFPCIAFRDTGGDRHAYLRGTGVKVWLLELIARAYDYSLPEIVEHLGLAEESIREGLLYAERYRQEIDEAIEISEWNAEHIWEILPNVEIVEFDADPA